MKSFINAHVWKSVTYSESLWANHDLSLVAEIVWTNQTANYTFVNFNEHQN